MCEKKTKFNQIIGELVLCLPAFIIAIFVNLWFECMLTVLCLLIFKPQYEYGYHTDEDKGYICIIISYITIIVSCAVGYMFKGEYLALLAFCVMICFINNYIGQIQYKSQRFDIIKEPYESLRKEKYVDKNTADKLKALNLSERDYKFACMKYIDKKRTKEIWKWAIKNKEDIEYDSVKQALWRINKKYQNYLKENNIVDTL